MHLRKTITLLSASLLLVMVASERSFTSAVIPPNPVLVFMGSEFYTANGQEWKRYQYFVQNFDAYPNKPFAAAPASPPCGTNTNSARTWVDFYNSNGKRLYGFCALAKASDLNKIWFAMERDALPPSWVYIEMTDRQTNTKYKSNLADTVE